MTVYITKYALTQGILWREVQQSELAPKMVTCINGHGQRECFHKPYWHTTRSAARKHAETMRMRKIVSLDFQIKKLESLTFA